MQTIKFLIVFLIGLIVLTGCGKKKEKQIIDLQAKNARLVSEYNQKDSLLNELFISINDIEKNLSDITAREKLITEAPDGEKRVNEDVRNKIMDEIILINNIMEENKQRLATLKGQLKKSDARVAALEENIKILTQRLEAKELEISELKAELVKLNFALEVLNATVDTLREESAVQSKVISQQESVINEMNAVWYVIGDKKELSEKGIIEKAGGWFSSKMKMSEMINPGNFTAADLRNLARIDFQCKKAELVTVHPEGSYRLMEENDMVTGLEIVNDREFWKSSRFLVIITR